MPQCYHIFSNSRDVYLPKNHHEPSSPEMVPTNPTGSWTIGRDVFNCELKNSELPSRQVCVNITDEAQYLAERYIAELLKETSYWGGNKDGTSRRKEQILDTGITLPSGKMISLGFTKIAHENSDTIVQVFKSKLNEIAAAYSNSPFTLQPRMRIGAH